MLNTKPLRQEHVPSEFRTAFGLHAVHPFIPELVQAAHLVEQLAQFPWGGL
jgi:hypothetical protein